jgi:hypothetical protein
MAALASEWVRVLGKATERRLFKKWGGAPTTRALRLRSSVGVNVRGIRRTSLTLLTGVELPDAGRELEEPEEADREISAAVQIAISRFRDRRVDAHLMHAETIGYGFRRNLRALKPLALVLILAVIMAVTLKAWPDGLLSPLWWFVLMLAIAGGLWMLLVTDKWVEEQANTYAERLFAALVSSSAPKLHRRRAPNSTKRKGEH